MENSENFINKHKKSINSCSFLALFASKIMNVIDANLRALPKQINHITIKKSLTYYTNFCNALIVMIAKNHVCIAKFKKLKTILSAGKKNKSQNVGEKFSKHWNDYISAFKDFIDAAKSVKEILSFFMTTENMQTQGFELQVKNQNFKIKSIKDISREYEKILQNIPVISPQDIALAESLKFKGGLEYENQGLEFNGGSEDDYESEYEKEILKLKGGIDYESEYEDRKYIHKSKSMQRLNIIGGDLESVSTDEGTMLLGCKSKHAFAQMLTRYKILKSQETTIETARKLYDETVISGEFIPEFLKASGCLSDLDNCAKKMKQQCKNIKAYVGGKNPVEIPDFPLEITGGVESDCDEYKNAITELLQYDKRVLALHASEIMSSINACKSPDNFEALLSLNGGHAFRTQIYSEFFDNFEIVEANFKDVKAHLDSGLQIHLSTPVSKDDVIENFKKYKDWCMSHVDKLCETEQKIIAIISAMNKIYEGFDMILNVSDTTSCINHVKKLLGNIIICNTADKLVNRFKNIEKEKFSHLTVLVSKVKNLPYAKVVVYNCGISAQDLDIACENLLKKGL